MDRDLAHRAAMRRDVARNIDRVELGEQLARLRERGGGGASSHASSVGSVTPAAARSSATDARSACRISGGDCSSR